MAYATAANVKAASALAAVQAKSDSDLTNVYIPRAERLINAYTGQNFNLSASQSIYVDGSGTPRVELSERLVTPTSVSIVNRSGVDGATLQSEITPDSFFNYNWWLVLGDEPVRLRHRVWREYSNPELGMIFPVGSKNIKITGTFGYASVPTEVTDATCLVVERLVAEEGDAAAKSGIFKREKIGDYEYEKATPSQGTVLRFSMIPEDAKLVLKNYLKPMVMGAI